MMCEYRLLKGYKYLHKTSCGNTIELEKEYKFCPVCRKKIKVVE